MCNVLTEGDIKRLRCITLGNARCQGCMKFKSLRDIKQQLWMTFPDWLNHTSESQSNFRRELRVASGKKVSWAWNNIRREVRAWIPFNKKSVKWQRQYVYEHVLHDNGCDAYSTRCAWLKLTSLSPGKIFITNCFPNWEILHMSVFINFI